MGRFEKAVQYQEESLAIKVCTGGDLYLTPETLNLKLKTVNPNPKTLNPQPQILNPNP